MRNAAVTRYIRTKTVTTAFLIGGSLESEKVRERLFGVGVVLAILLLASYFVLLLFLRRRIRKKWHIPSPQCVGGCEEPGCPRGPRFVARPPPRHRRRGG